MTDTPEQRVEEAARAICLVAYPLDHPLRKTLAPIYGEWPQGEFWWFSLAAAALASSERIIAEQEARIAELESRWDGLAAKIALAMQQQRDQTGLSYAAFAYAEAAMRSVLATPTSSR